MEIPRRDLKQIGKNSAKSKFLAILLEKFQVNGVIYFSPNFLLSRSLRSAHHVFVFMPCATVLHKITTNNTQFKFE